MESLGIIGAFDGVHTGHQYLIKEAKDLALKCGLLLTAITFEPQPSLYFNRTAKVLCSLEERLLLLKKYGVPRIEVIDFASVCNMSAEEFIREIHIEKEICKVMVGENFTFGKGKSASANDLAAYVQEVGMDTRILPLFKDSLNPVSSSKIRSLLSEGELEEAYRLLGHPYLLFGRVVAGKGLGTVIGYKTANIKSSACKLLPPQGVYASWVNHKGIMHRAVLNIGTNPTFGRETMIPEVHLIDYKNELLGDFLEIYPYKFLRQEIKFLSAEELSEAIAKDIEKTRIILKEETIPEFMI